MYLVTWTIEEYTWERPKGVYYTAPRKLSKVHAVDEGSKRAVCGVLIPNNWLTKPRKVNSYLKRPCEKCKSIVEAREQ